VPSVLRRLPKHIDAYYEPFLGGGSVFFALVNERRVRFAHLSDANERLVKTYQAVRDDVGKVIELLHEHARLSCREHYYSTRERLNSWTTDAATTAADFIYLNKTCFNGVWRVNKAGDFNVPWAHHERPFVVDEDGLRAASAALVRATVTWRPFDATPVDPDGVYYLDPPYDGTYAGYTGDVFTDDDQRELADYTEKLDVAGAAWLLSNADTPFVRQLYAGRRIQVVRSVRTVSRSAASRGQARELLVRAS
jgi:DNA adenine methylase